MNRLDVNKLLTYLSIQDGRKLNNAVVDAWYDTLPPEMTLQDAMDFARKFYADPNKQGKFLETRYLTACWRNMVRNSKPSEADITNEIHALGLDTWGSWDYRRQRFLGKSMKEAYRLAMEFSKQQGDVRI